ncbi:MAG: porin [Bacteroidota bacterium]
MKHSLLLKILVTLIVQQVTGMNLTHAQKSIAKDTSLKKKYKPEISGVVQVHYLNEFNTNGDSLRDPDGFRILRARLTAKGKISKKISYEVMVDPRAPEQGGVLRDAYLGFHYLKNQEIKVGQQKTQFGWENRESMTQLYTVNRAEMSDAVSRGENLRDIGIGLIGHIPINEKLRFENAVTFTNGTRMNVTGPYDFNSKKVCWGRLGLRYKSDKITVKIGGSFAFGGLRYLNNLIDDPSDDIYADIFRTGTDIQIDHDYFFMAAEFAMGTDKVSDTLIAEPIGYQGLLAIKTKYKAGPLIRYDVNEDEWKVLTLGAYYGLPKDRFRFLLNYVIRGNITDIPGGHDDRLYLQMQVTF